MPLFEIVNPSDPVTFEAPDARVAGWSVLMLGRGRMGAHDEHGVDVLPIFLFGGSNVWTDENGGEAWMRVPANLRAMANALESTAVADLNDRRAILAVANGDPKALERWNEARRSSLNNICGRARSLARVVRLRATELDAVAKGVAGGG